MSENEGGESKFMTGFLLGFLVGVLICLGVGGTFAVVYGQRGSMQARAAMEEAMMAREMAEVERMRAEEALRKAAEKAKGEGKATDKKEPPKSKEGETRLRLSQLDMAVAAYRLNEAAWPESLDILAQSFDGKPAYVGAQTLVDAWNRPFEYDPSVTQTKTGRPLISSLGEKPGESRPIRNWVDEKAKKAE